MEKEMLFDSYNRKFGYILVCCPKCPREHKIELEKYFQRPNYYSFKCDCGATLYCIDNAFIPEKVFIDRIENGEYSFSKPLIVTGQLSDPPHREVYKKSDYLFDESQNQ